jgi:hypothetical protein
MPRRLRAAPAAGIGKLADALRRGRSRDRRVGGAAKRGSEFTDVTPPLGTHPAVIDPSEERQCISSDHHRVRTDPVDVLRSS